MADSSATPAALQEVARLAGCRVETLRDYISLGLIEGGALSTADVTAIRLIESLETAGLSTQALGQAVRDGVLSFDFARNMMAFPVTMSDQTYHDAVASLGLDWSFAKAVFTAAGLASPEPEWLARDDDIALLNLVVGAREAGISERSLLRILRVFGHGLRRISDAQRDLMRIEVEEPMIASGIPVRAMLEETARRRRPLQELSFKASYVLHGRILEGLVFENIAVRLQNALAEHGLSPAVPENVEAAGFADISGYTEFMRRYGDHEGAEAVARLEEIVIHVLEPIAARIIKMLGDGVLIHFRQPELAPQAAAQVIEQVTQAGLPKIHVGLAAGPIIFRDGDIYGTTVNRAARLAVQARPGCVLADAEMRRLCGDTGAWEPVTLGPLKGLGEIAAFSWTPAPCELPAIAS